MATVRRRSVELVGADGGPLRADAWTAGAADGRPAVILCHGFTAFKDWGFLPRIADRLARAGLAAVTFNFSGSGVGPDETGPVAAEGRYTEIERFTRSTFSRDLDDLAIVCGALDAGALPGIAAPARRGLVGHSRGGGVAVLHAAHAGHIACLVTWAAIGTTHRWSREVIARWRADGIQPIADERTGAVLPLSTDVLDDLETNAVRLDIERAASQVTAPWLILHGTEDETVPLEEGERLHHAARPGVGHLMIIDGGSHTFGIGHPWSGSTPQFEQALEATSDWLLRHLY